MTYTKSFSSRFLGASGNETSKLNTFKKFPKEEKFFFWVFLCQKIRLPNRENLDFTVDKTYKEYIKPQLDIGDIEKSTYTADEQYPGLGN